MAEKKSAPKAKETKKKVETKVKTKVKAKAKASSKAKFIQVVGRKRSATARVRLYAHKKGEITVNDMAISKYFPGVFMERIYSAPLNSCNVVGKYMISIKVSGSGKMGQLGAVVHGISRALEKVDLEKFRPVLKKRGFLTRDPRKKERRKAGTGGKARRRKQSPKR